MFFVFCFLFLTCFVSLCYGLFWSTVVRFGSVLFLFDVVHVPSVVFCCGRDLFRFCCNCLISFLLAPIPSSHPVHSRSTSFHPFSSRLLVFCSVLRFQLLICPTFHSVFSFAVRSVFHSLFCSASRSVSCSAFCSVFFSEHCFPQAPSGPANKPDRGKWSSR